MSTPHPLVSFRLAQEPRLMQAELAARIGVHPSVLSRWESGAALIPSDKLRRVAEITGLSLDELLPGAPPSASPAGPPPVGTSAGEAAASPAASSEAAA